MALSRPQQACYCRCCCNDTDPNISDDMPLSDLYPEPYNRRYDCSCKRRWPIESPGIPDMITRARDLGRDGLALKLEEMQQWLEFQLKVLK